MSTIEEIVRIVEKGGYDLIVGFGGGSPIDVAKAAAVLPHTGDTVYDYVGIDQVKKKGLPIIAIPTTAGTGSECTAIAIFANEKLNVKQGLVSPFLMPNVALIDPELTVSCPPNVTAASGMDALIHNIEAYISVNATMHTDSLAYEGIKLISQSIRTAVFDGTNMWARDAMAMGSMMGGIAFGNAGVGAVHALSYPIGGMFHVPHGVANTMVLPWAMDFNKLACLRWMRQVGEAMGENMAGLSDREAADKTVAALRLLADDLGVPQYLSDVDIPESAIPDLVEGAKTQARLWNNNPRKYTPEDMEQVYRNMAVRPARGRGQGRSPRPSDREGGRAGVVGGRRPAHSGRAGRAMRPARPSRYHERDAAAHDQLTEDAHVRLARRLADAVRAHRAQDRLRGPQLHRPRRRAGRQAAGEPHAVRQVRQRARAATARTSWSRPASATWTPRPSSAWSSAARRATSRPTTPWTSCTATSAATT